MTTRPRNPRAIVARRIRWGLGVLFAPGQTVELVTPTGTRHGSSSAGTTGATTE